MLKVKRPLSKPSAAKKVTSRSMKTAKKFFTANPNIVARMKTATNVNRLARSMSIMTIPKAIEAKGTILSVRDTIMTIALTQKLMRQLKDVYLLSARDAWEYAGVIGVRIDPADKNYVTFNTPTRRTDRMRMRVDYTNRMVQFKMTYHSHPSPPGARSLATFPSEGDFRVYITNYPNIQANIILDNEGVYVFDLIERPVGAPRIDPALAYAQFNKLLELSGASKYEIVDNMLIYKVDKNRWKSFINKTVDPIMRKKFHISILFYFYDEIPKIRIRDPRPGVQ